MYDNILNVSFINAFIAFTYSLDLKDKEGIVLNSNSCTIQNLVIQAYLINFSQLLQMTINHDTILFFMMSRSNAAIYININIQIYNQKLIPISILLTNNNKHSTDDTIYPNSILLIIINSIQLQSIMTDMALQGNFECTNTFCYIGSYKLKE